MGGFGASNYGLGFEEQAEPPSSEMVANAMRPYVETCIEAFGTRRSMFESNFPVDKVGLRLPDLLERMQAAHEGRKRDGKG